MLVLRVVSRGGRSRISAIALALVATLAWAAPVSAGEISGTAFADADRDALHDDGEATFGEHRVYVLRSDGSYVANALTQADGSYVVSGLEDGPYIVEYSSPSWWPLRAEWVPTTTGGSLRPRIRVDLQGRAVADFGWRRIVRSTDVRAPITEYTGQSGLKVASYNDVVAAREIHDRLAMGVLGAEAATVTVRFDLGDATSTSSSVGQTEGRYANFASVCTVAYSTWLDEGDSALTHEYGHAWSLFHAYVDQQDPAMGGYVAARGLAEDSRLGSSYAWGTGELIAEDYRQLFGSPTARLSAQMNRDVPPAIDVPGLRDYLTGPFQRATSSPAPVVSAPPLEVTGVAMNPAPVSTGGTASFSLSQPAQVTVQILTGKGSVVKTLISDVAHQAGTATSRWDRTNNTGRRVRQGTYELVVEAVQSSGGVSQSRIRFSVS